MNTRQFFLPIVLSMMLGMFATVSFGCWNIPADRDTGNFITEDRQVSNFDRLEIGGAFKVYLTQGETEKLSIEADENEINEIITEVSGGKLKIYTKSGWGNRYHEMTIHLTFKDLEYIDFSGAVEVVSENTLHFTDMKMDISGAADLKLEFTAGRFEAEFSGASEVDFRGSCKSGYIELSGASEFDASELEFEDLTVEVSGASNAKVWATGTLDINASGASDIKYKGSPKNISLEESGASSVRQLK